jgi:hypothetical protein
MCTVTFDDCLSSHIVNAINHLRYKTNNAQARFCPVLPDIRKAFTSFAPRAFLKVAVGVLSWRWMRLIGGIIPTAERQSTRRKVCPIVSLCTTIGRGSNSGLRSRRPATNHASHGTAWGVKFFGIMRVSKFGSCRTGKHIATQWWTPAGQWCLGKCLFVVTLMRSA